MIETGPFNAGKNDSYGKHYRHEAWDRCQSIISSQWIQGCEYNKNKRKKIVVQRNTPPPNEKRSQWNENTNQIEYIQDLEGRWNEAGLDNITERGQW
ncbi:hypothetical protein KSZ_01470 [Dictyobacter formicarum]|uniref:Uncharacterized protein n=1 Tax=Dictyobacter formicarum TaxID=2778368 RepID=A0ABQ3VA78_9CHLR|nr:hypothetical protein KSZ_01470 [Dictyobacter formicarum]